jgi:prepilin-type N-terminal cleavage/methylation domain-containing protein
LRLAAVATGGSAASPRHPHGRRRTGFTLVEVIVVLVILAILAAIAIPALTGYIDKAKVIEYKAQMDSFRKASQTLIVEEMAANGGQITTYPTPAAFESVTKNSEYESYAFKITDEEYKKLTGASLYDLDVDLSGAYYPMNWNVTTDRSGAILMSFLDYGGYFAGSSDRLVIYWFSYSDDDPYGQYVADKKTSGTQLQKDVFSNATQGINFYRVHNWTSAKKLDW